MYKGCTRDAHRMINVKSYVHPVGIPCTPLVHGALGWGENAIGKLALAGDCGVGVWDGCMTEVG
ncbi:MAG: hypothetical protein BWX68_00438 [Verrucomicrobia bacterium ADurb.Bin063]|nr:MAG: hypothetical protein BWX68_00438 [Verrucomicrobia bacterium ADurb.Bin063]